MSGKLHPKIKKVCRQLERQARELTWRGTVCRKQSDLGAGGRDAQAVSHPAGIRPDQCPLEVGRACRMWTTEGENEVIRRAHASDSVLTMASHPRFKIQGSRTAHMCACGVGCEGSTGKVLVMK